MWEKRDKTYSGRDTGVDTITNPEEGVAFLYSTEPKVNKAYGWWEGEDLDRGVQLSPTDNWKSSLITVDVKEISG